MAPNPALELSRAQRAAPCGEADGALQSVSACSGAFLHKQTPISVLTAFWGKFLLKCCFEIREKYLLCNWLWSFEIYPSSPVCRSTLLSFRALTETFWVHSLYVRINLL